MNCAVSSENIAFFSCLLKLSTSLPNFPLPRRPIEGEKGRKEEEEQQRKTIKNHQKLHQPEEGKEQRRQQGKVARITTGGGGGGHHRDEVPKMMGTFLGTVKLKETAVEFWRGTIGWVSFCFKQSPEIWS